MFVQTQKTPNPDSLKFLPGKLVSNNAPFEVTDKNTTNNKFIRNILSINGVKGIFLGSDFISVNKEKNVDWEEIKHIVISFINEYYQAGNNYIVNNDLDKKKVNENLVDIEKKIIKILDNKIRPAVARDGGDIKFEEFKDGVVKVKLQGSCSGCPSSIITLKNGIENMLRHYIPEVKEVISI